MPARRTTHRAHRSEHGSWLLVHAEPAPQLRPYVHGYDGYREEARRFKRHLQAPTSNIPLIFNLGPPYRIDSSHSREQVISSFAAGLHDGPVVVGADGSQYCVQADLTPLGAHRVFGIPMHEMSNRVVALDDLFGERAPLFVERLHDASSWEERFAIVDAILTTRIERAPATPRELAWAWSQIDERGGDVSIREMAGELGWSHRRLIAKFREHIGLPPKKLARIVRFDRAVSMIYNDDGHACQASIAHAAGYFDQSHLHRDFRQFAGVTPAEFLRRRLPDMTGLIGD